MHILVTGSSGFIGRHVVGIAHARGHMVGEADRDDPIYAHRVSAYDAVIHLAADIDIKESFEKPWKYVDNNIGTLKLLSGAQRVVFASSAAVYGNFSPYGATKALGEVLLPENSISLRMFNPFGPGEYHEPETHIVPLLARSEKTGKKVTLFQNGSQIRDFITAYDAAMAFVMAAESDYVGTLDLCDRPLSIKKVAELMAVDVALEKSLRDSGDTDELIGNNYETKRILGWKPELDVRKELIDWRNWYK